MLAMNTVFILKINVKNEWNNIAAKTGSSTSSDVVLQNSSQTLTKKAKVTEE